MNYCIYLRKSRSDLQSEISIKEDALLRHEKILTTLADTLEIKIKTIYREIVSGDSIKNRPVMTELLSEIEAGLWDGVLVMEVERLARGDTIDQGIISRAFSLSDTKIITPLKTYDPLNEFDEEYFEFGLFMSRREYKTINRRLQNGRFSSASEGKFIGSIPPYGYDKIKLVGQKGYTLCINKNEADVVKYIFELYTNSNNSTKYYKYNINFIAKRLNSLLIPPRKTEIWSDNTISSILKNPVYMGKIRYKYRAVKKKTLGKDVVLSRPLNPDPSLIFDGLHEAIIDEKTFKKAQLRHSSSLTPRPSTGSLKSSLQGLIFCQNCEKALSFKPQKNGNNTLLCRTKNCPSMSVPSKILEENLLLILSVYYKNFTFDFSKRKPPSSSSEKPFLSKRLTALDKQKTNIYAFFENGTYDQNTFSERLNSLNITRENLLNELHSLDETQTNSCGKTSYTFEEILTLYHEQFTLEEQHLFLSQLVDKVVYTRDKYQNFNNNRIFFTLNLQISYINDKKWI